MIVMDLVLLNHDARGEFIHNKIQGVCNETEVTYLCSHQMKMKENLIENDNCIFMSEEDDKIIRQRYPDDIDLLSARAFDGIDVLERFFEVHIKNILDKNDIDVVYSWGTNCSMEKVCKKYGIHHKYIEGTALRISEYYNYEWAWLTDNFHTRAKEEGELRYKNFCQQKNALVINKPIPSKSLLFLGAKEEKILSLVQSCMGKEKYQLGVAIPCWSLVSNCGWTADRVLDYIDELNLNLDDVLIRPYPENYTYDERIKNCDNSASALEFISRCSSIMSSSSNITFEAMMLGKKVIDLGDIFYSSAVYNKFEEKMDGTIYDDWYMNFLFFGVFVHWNRLFDLEYVKWRNTNPSEAEIFNDNYNYFFENIIKENYTEAELHDWKKVINRRKASLNSGKSEKWEFLSHIVNINWKEEKTIYICGIGRKAVLVKESIEKLGGRISGFVVTDHRTEQEYAGLRVYNIKEIEKNKENLFLISASIEAIKIEIYMNLVNNGFERIVV